MVDNEWWLRLFNWSDSFIPIDKTEISDGSDVTIGQTGTSVQNKEHPP